MPPSTYKGRPMRYFLIDRLAAGFDEKSVCHQFRMFFEVPDTDEQILSMLSDRDSTSSEIEVRKQELMEEIDRTNITSLILRHVKRLDSESENTDDIGDLVKIITALNDTLVTLKPRDAASPSLKSMTVNYYNQFNATFIQDLESQNIIRIVDREKFAQLFLGPGEAKGDEGAAVTSPPTKEEGKNPASLLHMEPPSKTVSEPEPANSPKRKKERAKAASPDDIAAFL